MNSNRYTIEPPNSGKVILKTTHGEVHIDLWARETPLACRNFIQLCMEGFYDNSPFYRVVTGFLVQAGNEEIDESVYGAPFRDEFHSRLKFSHRGMVAMVNGRMNDNKSHFFITTDKAEYLYRKNTIFGKVGNNTLYNVIRISEVEVDPNDRPLILPRILSCEIAENPFEDIIPREISKPNPQLSIPAQKPQLKSKVLISYDEEDLPTAPKAKILSSHDVLNDPYLSTQTAKPEEPARKKLKKNFLSQKNPSKNSPISDDDEEFDLKMKKKVLAQREIFIEQPLEPPVKVGSYEIRFDKNKTIISKAQNPETEFQELKKNLLKLKTSPLGSNNPSVHQEQKDLETFLSPLQRQKYNFHQYNKKTKGREHETLTKLEGFISKVQGTSSAPDWVTSKLKFSTDSSKAYSYNKDLPAKALNHEDEEKVIIDPKKRLKQFDDDFDDNMKNLQQILSHENFIQISRKQNNK